LNRLTIQDIIYISPAKLKQRKM